MKLFPTPWTVALQAPLSMQFPRQKYGSGLPFPSPGGLPDPGIKPGSPTLQVDFLWSELPGKPMEVKYLYTINYNTLMKDIEADINEWKDTPCLCIGRINIIKISKLCKAVTESIQSL